MNLPMILIINHALTVFMLCILQNARAHKNRTHVLVILHIKKYNTLTEFVIFWTLTMLVVVLGLRTDMNLKTEGFNLSLCGL